MGSLTVIVSIGSVLLFVAGPVFAQHVASNPTEDHRQVSPPRTNRRMAAGTECHRALAARRVIVSGWRGPVLAHPGRNKRSG